MNGMSNEELGADSLKMIEQIVVIEALIRQFDTGESIEGVFLNDINYGSELLNRGFIKIFSSPKSINQRVRTALIKLLLSVDEKYPSLKKPDFDEFLKKLLRREYGLS